MIFKTKESFSRFSGIREQTKHLMFCKEGNKLVGSICIIDSISILSPTNESDRRYFNPGYRGTNRMKIIDSFWMGHQSIVD